jgi:glutamyl/glutaminyl-tRNA synthetase
MEISHVIRGEEWLSSMPKHLLLYRAFGWTPPEFAHLPLILNKDRTKLSKRQGDVAVEDYIKKGFLPEGLLNYLALLGWSNKDDRDFFTLKELKEVFKLENINKSGAIFDLNKLIHINGLHWEKTPITKRVELLENFLLQKNITLEKNWLTDFVRFLENRIKYMEQVFTYLNPFIKDFDSYDPKGKRKFFNITGYDVLTAAFTRLENIENWELSIIEDTIQDLASNFDLSFGKIAQILRLALTGQTISLGIFETIYLLGKEKTLHRIEKAILYINEKEGSEVAT